MLLFWILAAVLTAVVVLLIVPPLLKVPPALGDRMTFDMEVYRDQLAELERDVARGGISEQQAASAKAEIGRRMLALSNEKGAADAPLPGDPKRNRMIAAVVALLLPLGGLILYLPLGKPELPARPFAARDLEAEAARPPASVVQAVESLKQKLAASPDDLAGWQLLAQAEIRMGRSGDAIPALRQILRLSPDDNETKAALAEALIHGSGGKVLPEAESVLKVVLAADGDDPRARYYLAMARQQKGDDKGALADWQALMASSPADAPWVEMVKARIEETASTLGLDIVAAVPKTLPPSAPAAAGAPPNQGSAPATAGAGALPPERQEMIRGMVAKLAERLGSSPDDADGWMRLARSYRVLGENSKAVDAARNAVKYGPQRAEAYFALADALAGGLDQPNLPSPLPPGVSEALQQVLTLDPNNGNALWLLGMAAANAGDKAKAANLWGRLLAQLDPKTQDYTFVKGRLDGLK